METNICKNCNYQTSDEFCSKCGHPVKLKKIDRDYIVHEISDTLFTRKGFLYTTKRMFLNPGTSARQYIKEDRSQYVKPVTYLIITSLIYTLVSHFLKTDFLAQFKTPELTTMTYIKEWIVENRGYSSLIMDFWIAFWIKIFFRKFNYNLFEIFIFMCYLSGIKVLFISFALILQTLIHSNIMVIAIVLALIFSFWAVGQFFEKKKAKSYLSAVLAYICGALSISVILSVVSVIVDIIRQ